MSDLYVHDWNLHQSYRSDRGQPPWIKVHRALVRSHKWLMLSDAERGQLVAIWILAADREGLVRNDAKLLQKICHMDSEPDLGRFLELGFLDPKAPDAKVTPTRRQPDDTHAASCRIGAPPEEADKADKAEEADASAGVFSDFTALWKIHASGNRSKALAAYREALTRTDAQNILQAWRQHRDTLTDSYRGHHLHKWLSESLWEQYPPKARGSSGYIRPWELDP